MDGLINGDGLYPDGLIIIYSLANGWAYIRGGLKTGGTLKWDFTGSSNVRFTSASKRASF